MISVYVINSPNGVKSFSIESIESIEWPCVYVDHFTDHKDHVFQSTIALNIVVITNNLIEYTASKYSLALRFFILFLLLSVTKLHGSQQQRAYPYEYNRSAWYFDVDFSNRSLIAFYNVSSNNFLLCIHILILSKFLETIFTTIMRTNEAFIPVCMYVCVCVSERYMQMSMNSWATIDDVVSDCAMSQKPPFYWISR